MKSKMKMNNFLILLLILFIVLLFLVYYYKYLRKQQFESFQQPKYKTKTFTLTPPPNIYIISDFLDCDAKYAKVVSISTDKGKVTFPTVNDSANTCENSTSKTKFTYIIDSADLIKLQNDNVKNITIKIEYKVANDIIEQKNIINI